MKRLHIHIKGVVQGVGFRPFIYSLARLHQLTGWVINDSSGVEIEVDGSLDDLQSFLQGVISDPPPLAQIVKIEHQFIDAPETDIFTDFQIRQSLAVEGERVLISPDVAVCQDCLREMYDPANPRYRYPFLNCTNCGPRFTIIEDIPYDRPKTTMRDFPMCSACKEEYGNPSDRRFHAQPTCCPICGPNLQYLDSRGNEIDGDPINLAISALKDGKIVSIKGLGGFHLACDAANPDAVRTLRERKHREAKPLAVMVGGISAAKYLAEVSDDAARALLSPARPILILPETLNSPLADKSIRGVNGGVRTIGIILPYTPIHHLLFRPLPISSPDNSLINIPEEIGGTSDTGTDQFIALVMTSANISDEPIAADNDEALSRLGGIADAFLMHDRKINRRVDDSVATIRDGVTTIWRWGRGHVPRPVSLPRPLPPVLGVGAELKTTICHIRCEKAFVSPHIGDLKTYETFEYLRETIAHQEKILGVHPIHAACDMHPDYHSTRWAHEESGLQVIEVQHHHAHVAALLAEHGIPETEILALAMDGTGYGVDHKIWGGEIFRANAMHFMRLGHFTYAPLPGGDTAIREPWRTALGRLREIDTGILFKDIDPGKLAAVKRMISADINCPHADSLGRLFDAAAYIAGIGLIANFDGQFPMLLEAACEGNIDVQFDSSLLDDIISVSDDDGILIDGGKIISVIANKKISGESTKSIARFFHRFIIEILVKSAEIARDQTGINTIGLTGGCFMNKFLHENLKSRLISSGFQVLTHRIMPPNDGCISLGQAVSAGYRLIKNR